MKVTFWGVRGSFPASLPPYLRYGGNTPCLEVDTGSSTILIDAGTGIRAAGKSLAERGVEEIHLLLSHTHWDHIQGFPHFAPLYREKTRIGLYGFRRPNRSLRDIIRGQQQPPFFPISLDQVQAELEFTELEDGQVFSIDDTRVACRRLNHPGVSGGFRLEQDHFAFAYISDLDLETPLLLADDLPTDSARHLQRLRDGACDLGHRADLVVFDTFFLPEEYQPDWGHSRPDEALSLALEAGAGKLALFHHEPHRRDEEMDQILARYQEKTGDRVELIAAREGLELTL